MTLWSWKEAWALSPRVDSKGSVSLVLARKQELRDFEYWGLEGGLRVTGGKDTGSVDCGLDGVWISEFQVFKK